MSVRDHVLRMPRTRRPIRTKEHQVMAHPRSDRPMGAIRFLVLWLLTLMLVATQIAAPVVLAAPQAPDTAPAAAPAAPTSTITLHVFAARTEPDADIGPVTAGQAVAEYKWMINEDNTGTNAQRNPNPGSGCSPADAGYPDSCAWTLDRRPAELRAGRGAGRRDDAQRQHRDHPPRRPVPHLRPGRRLQAGRHAASPSRPTRA